MNKLFYSFFFILFSFSSNIYAQTSSPKYSVPDEYSFNSVEDYAKYEPQILETIDWYLNTSMAFETERRMKANEFFVKWIVGTPNITIVFDNNILGLVSHSPDLMTPLLMGWVKYSLDNNYSKDNIKCCIAGIRAATEFYDKNKFFFKDDEGIEKFKKMDDKKLAKYLSKFPSLSDKKNN